MNLQLGADSGDAVFPCHLGLDSDGVVVQSVPVEVLTGGDVHAGTQGGEQGLAGAQIGILAALFHRDIAVGGMQGAAVGSHFGNIVFSGTGYGDHRGFLLTVSISGFRAGGLWYPHCISVFAAAQDIL